MITSSKEREFQAKQEGNNNTNESKFSRATTSSSRQWSASRNPRIVRVSRTFGGKDRHSKVCTIRGLRDRRIRLSVPTAIQLYDLQDRLGLGQPSKVVDWLLDATKNDIDQLPPLQMPQGSSHFGQFFVQPTPQEANNNSTTNVVPLFFDENSPFKINDMNVEMERSSSSKHWDGRGDGDSRGKSKEVGRDHHRSMMMKVDGEDDDDEEEEENLDDGGIGSYNSAQVSAQNFFPIANQSSIIPGFLNMPYNSYYQWEPSNLSLSSSQFGFSDHSHHTSSNDNDPPPSHVSMVPSSLALSSGSQLIFCPPPTQTNTLLPSFFPTYNPSPYFTTPQESSSTSTSQQHFSHYSLMQQQQPLHSSITSPTMKSFPLNVNPRFLLPHPSHNINSTQSDKDKNVS